MSDPTAIPLAARCQTSSSQRALVPTPNSHWYQCRPTSQVDAPCPCPHSLAVCPRPRAFSSRAGVRLPEPGSVSSKTAHAPTPASGGSLRPEAAACRPTTGSPRVVRLKGPYETPTASPASPAAPGSDSLSASFPSSHCAALDATAADPPPRAKELAPHSRPCALHTRNGSTWSVASAHPSDHSWPAAASDSLRCSPSPPPDFSRPTASSNGRAKTHPGLLRSSSPPEPSPKVRNVSWQLRSPARAFPGPHQGSCVCAPFVPARSKIPASILSAPARTPGTKSLVNRYTVHGGLSSWSLLLPPIRLKVLKELTRSNPLFRAAPLDRPYIGSNCTPHWCGSRGLPLGCALNR